MTLNVVEWGIKHRDSDSENKRKEKRVFFGAIMGGFSAPQNSSKGMAKRKIAELMGVHVAAPTLKASKTIPIFGFNDDEKDQQRLR